MKIELVREGFSEGFRRVGGGLRQAGRWTRENPGKVVYGVGLGTLVTGLCMLEFGKTLPVREVGNHLNMVGALASFGGLVVQERRNRQKIKRIEDHLDNITKD